MRVGDARTAFVGVIGSDPWWLGEVVIELCDGGSASVLYVCPNADGDLLEWVGWGPQVQRWQQQLLHSFRDTWEMSS